MKRWGVIKQLCPDARKGVEVGVFCGENALALMRTMPELFLTLVDPYAPYNHPGMDGSALNWARDVMRLNLKPFKRWKHIELESRDAADLFEKGSQDFVFIDGDHDEPAVRADVLAWMPKVRPGGYLIGHDASWPGVAPVVEEMKAELHADDCWSLRVPEC